jgi:class 3 adenylate cyclase
VGDEIVDRQRLDPKPAGQRRRTRGIHVGHRRCDHVGSVQEVRDGEGREASRPDDAETELTAAGVRSSHDPSFRVVAAACIGPAPDRDLGELRLGTYPDPRRAASDRSAPLKGSIRALPADRQDGNLKELTYRFDLELASSPERLWPLVSDTNRFNRDARVPPVVAMGVGRNARRRLRLTKLGIPIEWEEEPFEWVRPHRFSVVRRYARGPLDWMQVSAELEPRPDGGTRLLYDVRARPRNLLGRVAAAIEIGLSSRRRFAAVLRRYDAGTGRTDEPVTPRTGRHAPGAEHRIEAARASLVQRGAAPGHAERLAGLVRDGDEITVGRLRPYVIADAWGVPRRDVLELCLLATRSGLLELRWELNCPLCRGAAASEESLAGVNRHVHCETCLIDFEVDFERSVEITFRPTPAIRRVEERAFCVAGPQVTPHVLAQQMLPAGGRRRLALRLEPGSYRVRALALPGARRVTVSPDGAAEADVRAEAGGWPDGELPLAEVATLMLENATPEEQLLILERTEWGDGAATAADVTALQVFRDLFSSEALRPGEPVSVGSLTVVFTDLRGSTRFYRDVGDAPAFGAVVEHLAVLRRIVSAEEGAVVKTMGDAIMAVFTRPVGAVRAMLEAQRAVADKPLALKVGIHTGPCIAINQNGVLDYFGSTVNLAARLEALSSGDDLVVSEAVLADPEVAALSLAREPVEASLKGFEEDGAFPLWRVRG